MIEWLRCFPYTLYILMFCLVSLRESAAVKESERSFRFTSPELSTTLVLVLKCLTVAISLSAYDSPHITESTHVHTY